MRESGLSGELLNTSLPPVTSVPPGRDWYFTRQRSVFVAGSHATRNPEGVGGRGASGGALNVAAKFCRPRVNLKLGSGPNANAALVPGM